MAHLVGILGVASSSGNRTVSWRACYAPGTLHAFVFLFFLDVRGGIRSQPIPLEVIAKT